MYFLSRSMCASFVFISAVLVASLYLFASVFCIIYRVVDAPGSLNYRISARHDNNSLASAFDLFFIITFHRISLPQIDSLTTSLVTRNHFLVRESDGSYTFTSLLDELALNGKAFDMNITVYVPSSPGQVVLNGSVTLHYNSSPSSGSCNRSRYTIPSIAFPESCTRNLSVTTSLRSNTTSAVHRTIPGQSVDIHVIAFLHDETNQTMTFSVNLRSSSRPSVKISDIARLSHVAVLSEK